MRDVFISYSRKDKPFVEKLHHALEAQNRDAWVDWDDIPLTAKWWQEIQRGIEGANTFVFVMSDDSVKSKVCQEEIDHAVQHNKRLVPIVYREDFEMAKVHPKLSQHNWLFFRQTDEFETGLNALLNAIETDLEYVRSHTRILERAIEWQEQKRNESFGLKGEELRSAEAWLVQGETKEPKPTELQQNYIRASRSAEDANEEARQILVRAEQQAKEQLAKAEDNLEVVTRKANRRNLFSLLGIGAAVAIAGTASIQAERRASEARSQTEKLQDQAKGLEKDKTEAQKQLDRVRQEQKLVATKLTQAEGRLKQADVQVKAAVQKTQVAEQQAQGAQRQAREAAQQAEAAETLAQSAEQNRQQAEEQSRQAQRQAEEAQKTADDARRAQVVAQKAQRDAEMQREIVQKGTDLERRGVAMLRLPSYQYRDRERLVAALELGGTVKDLLKKRATPKDIRACPAMSPLIVLRSAVNSVMQFAEFQGRFPRFSPDGKQVLTWDDTTHRLYDLWGKKLAEFQGGFPSFSPDSKQVLTISPDEDITSLYDLEGNLLAEYLGLTVSLDSKYQSLSLGFTQDGTQILTLTSDGNLRVWDVDAELTVDGGLDDLMRRGCEQLKNFWHRPEDVKRVCPEG
ncbi:TIR domain-containing protein [Leptolyngbya sp. AN03gr2]|uniref:toll/interleukin-1 receptor domain-containing protein n=1 Tax=unclassified Leptolyngbya TaxID=2650499 RepID=UPI003D322853